AAGGGGGGAHRRGGGGEPLALAARQVGAALLERRVVALRQALDELLGARLPRRPRDLLERRGLLAGRDVVADRPAEQEALGQNHGHVAAQVDLVELADVVVVD